MRLEPDRYSPLGFDQPACKPKLRVWAARRNGGPRFECPDIAGAAMRPGGAALIRWQAEVRIGAIDRGTAVEQFMNRELMGNLVQFRIAALRSDAGTVADEVADVLIQSRVAVAAVIPGNDAVSQIDLERGLAGSCHRQRKPVAKSCKCRRLGSWCCCS